MRKTNLFLSAAAISVLAAVAGLSSAAHAQETTATAEAGAADDAIIVTARRRSEDIAKVPISITAFTEQTLQKKSVSSIADLVKITPGLNIASGGNRANVFITIRGQSKGVVGNIQPGVITYVNEVPLPNYGSIFPTYDIANIQVLKGPQGTLFGRNAMGGAVLTYTKQPTHDFGGYVKGDVASFDYKAIEGAVNVPIIKDKVALRLAGQLSDGGGYTKALMVSQPTIVNGVATPGTLTTLSHDYDDERIQAFRASLLIEPIDGIKNVTVADYFKSRGLNNTTLRNYYPTGYNGGSPAFYFSPTSSAATLATCGSNNLICDYRAAFPAATSGERTNIANVDPWDTRIITKSLSNTTSIELGDHATLKNIFGYRGVDFFSIGDLDGTPLIVGQTVSSVQIHQYTDELQLAGSLFDEKLKYTVGGFYFNEGPSGRAGTNGLEVTALFGLSHTLTYTYLHYKSKAVYGQFDYSLDSIIPGLTITAGARQTWDSVYGCSGSVTLTSASPTRLFTSKDSAYMPTEDQCVNNTVVASSYPSARTALSQNLPLKKADKLTYTLGANWQITPDVMIYGAHRRGYRAGSYNTPLMDQGFLGQIQAFSPETLEDWEVGAKLRWGLGDVHGTFNVAAFTGKDKNLQFAVPATPISAGVCVPAAIGSGGRAANCVNSAGAAGVSIVHPLSTTVVNAGDITIRGFEANGTISPFDGLTIGANVAYLDYTVGGSLSAAIDPNFRAYMAAAGQAIPASIILAQQPTWTYGFDLDIALPGKVLSSDVSLNANFKHSDRFYNPSIWIPGYNVVDARLTFGNIGESNVDLSVYVKNLTNEDYQLGGGSGSPGQFGVESVRRAAPRTIGLSVRYNFGG